MKYTKIPSDMWQKVQMNAGILVRTFDPATGEYSGLLGATTGGFQFSATPNYVDLGEDVDNCPKGTKELKILDYYDVSGSGTFVSVDPSTGKDLIGAADIDSNDSTHIVPRNDLAQADFKDLWWIGDYSNVNTGANAGFCAIRMKNTLNTGGFQIQSSDKAKGNFAFTFTGHYSINDPDEVPFEVYIKGSATTQPNVTLDKHSATVEVDETITLKATTVPDGATVTWTSSDTDKATVSGGVVTGKAAAAAGVIITASITQGGVTYTDTCTVVVTS